VVSTIQGLSLRRRLEEEIPPFRPVVVQLLHLAGDPTVSIGTVVNLLSTDQSLSSDLLRLANSPLFAAGREIAELRYAAAYLGLDLVRSIAVTAAARGLLDLRPSPLAKAFWRHSLATSLMCRQMCGFALVPPDLAYTAGLLHDVGQIALIHLFPEYPEVIGRDVDAGASITEAETRNFGMDHCQAGRWLLSRWRLPLVLLNVVAGHEEPPTKPVFDKALTRLVHAGSLAADWMGLSVIAPARPIGLPDLVAFFPESRQETLRDCLPAMMDRVLGTVNEVEMEMCVV